METSARPVHNKWFVIVNVDSSGGTVVAGRPCSAAEYDAFWWDGGRVGPVDAGLGVAIFNFTCPDNYEARSPTRQWHCLAKHWKWEAEGTHPPHTPHTIFALARATVCTSFEG